MPHAFAKVLKITRIFPCTINSNQYLKQDFFSSSAPRRCVSHSRALPGCPWLLEMDTGCFGALVAPRPFLALAMPTRDRCPTLWERCLPLFSHEEPRRGARELLLPWHVERQPREQRAAPGNRPFPAPSSLSIFFLKEEENHSFAV